MPVGPMPRRRLVPLLAAAVLAALALLAPAAAHARIAFPLGHDGRWITDAHGRVVLLHGFNVVDKLAPYAPDALGFGADDAAFLAAEGYDTVRLGVMYQAVEPSPGVYDDAYLARIERTVNELGRQGIAVLLDFHQDMYSERFQGEGWPDWAVLDDGLPAEPKAGFPRNYAGMPALNAAFDHFWANTPGPDGVGLQDHYAAAWRHVAQRFARNPYVLGYDLLNEPWPGSGFIACATPDGCPEFDATLRAFSQRVVAAIRTVDPDTLAFYEPNVLFNSGARSRLGDLGDPHAGLSFHDYCAGTDRAACHLVDDKLFRQAEAQAATGANALLLTEFGATDELEVLDDMADRADRFLIGWQEWAYCGCGDPTTTGPGDVQAVVLDPAKPPRGSNLATGKLDMLSRPYPQVVAGTPTLLRFDRRTRRMELRYRPKGRGTTEIALPRRQYPRGYSVRVAGGRVRSKPGARRLVVLAKPGAREVRVTLTRG
jgi:endoglycosylceramidase